MTDNTFQSIAHSMITDYMSKRHELLENFLLEYLLHNPHLSINDIELVEGKVGEYDVIWFYRERATDAP